MNAAVFSDVDGTLINGSVPRLILQYGLRKRVYTSRRAAGLRALLTASRLAPALRKPIESYAALISGDGFTPEQLESFFDDLMPRALQQVNPAVLAALHRRQNEGLALVLVSAAGHPFVVRLARELGGDGEGTHVQQINGVYTSKVEGAICQGPAKAARVQQVIAARGLDAAACAAFGDSGSDIPYLSLVGHPCAVNPDRKLTAEARRRGWPILRTP